MSSSQRAKKSILFLVVVNFALLVQSGMMAEDLKNANKNILYARTMRSDLGALRLAVLSVVLDRLILQNKQSTDVGLEIKHYSEKLSIDLLELRGGFKGDKKLSAKVDEITQAAQALQHRLPHANVSSHRHESIRGDSRYRRTATAEL